MTEDPYPHHCHAHHQFNTVRIKKSGISFIIDFYKELAHNGICKSNIKLPGLSILVLHIFKPYKPFQRRPTASPVPSLIQYKTYDYYSELLMNNTKSLGHIF